MAAKNIAVFGIFPDQLTAEDALDSLKEEGFRNTDISVLFPDNQGSRELVYEQHTKAPEGAVAGGGSGAVLGGALGWLVGMGVLSIPGLGPFMAAGPLMGMMGGLGVGTTIGGIAGALMGMEIPEYEAVRYEGRVSKGGILISVHSDDQSWAQKARSVLERSGGESIASTGEARADYLTSNQPLPRTIT